MRQRKKKMWVILLLGCLWPLFNPMRDVYAKVDPSIIVADPAKGTAIQEIEDAIAKGSEASGIGRYIWGGGHRGMPPHEDFNFPDVGLDCSGFVGAAYYYGAGVNIGESWGMPTTGGLISDRFAPYLRSSHSSYDDAERGDLVVNHSNTHVVIYLGKDSQGNHVILDSSAHGGLPDLNIGTEAPSGGVAIRIDNSPGQIVGILDMEKLITEGQDVWEAVDPEPLKDPVDGGTSNNGTNNRDNLGDPFEPLDNPIVEYEEHIDRGAEDAHKGVQKQNVPWWQQLLGQ